MLNSPLRILFVLLLQIGSVHSVQTQSFSKTSSESFLNEESSISANDNGVVILSGDSENSSLISRELALTKLDIQGEVDWSINLTNLNLRNQIRLSAGKYNLIKPILQLSNGESLIGTSIENAVDRNYLLALIDEFGKTKWSTYVRHEINTFQPPHMFEAPNGGLYTFLTIQSSETRAIISFQHFDLDGELIFEKQIIDLDGKDSDFYKYHILENGEIAISKYSIGQDRSYISVFDSSLNYLYGASIDLYVKQIIEFNDDIFISGQELPYNNFNAESVICKLDEDLRFDWGLATKANSFNEMYKLDITEEGLFFSYTDVPENLIIKINTQGDLLKGIRVPLNHLFIANNFEKFSDFNYLTLAWDQINKESILSVVDTSLQSSCFDPVFCPNIRNIEFDVVNLNEGIFDTFDLEVILEDFPLQTQIVNADFADKCIDTENFDFAIPFFVTDDTICVNEIVNLSELQNVEASTIMWDLPGSNLVSSSDQDPSGYTYSQSGVYTITQTIVVNNCESVFSKDIVVQPSIDTSGVLTSRIICQDEPILLESNIQNVDFLWLPDSSSQENLLVDQPGSYTLEVSNRHCENSIAIEVSEISLELLEVDLGPDTSICIQKSFILNPELNQNVEFTWEDGHLELDRAISLSGLYTLRTNIGDCRTENSIFVQAEDCSTQIYIPNAFSPNLDGINDDFFPLGNFFEVESFKIYDRWGTLVHDNSVDPWNGRFRGKELPVGIYVYSLQIKNILLDEIELLKGDVALVR